jgi:hypothetical protein
MVTIAQTRRCEDENIVKQAWSQNTPVKIFRSRKQACSSMNLVESRGLAAEPHVVTLRATHKETSMLWTIFVIILVLWLLGFSFHIAGGLIHLLLVVALVVLIVNLVSGRRTA